MRRLSFSLQARDRVEVTGLRPSPLPHHRTCGLPHPAVGLGDRLVVAKTDEVNPSTLIQRLLFLPSLAPQLAVPGMAPNRNPPASLPFPRFDGRGRCHVESYRTTSRFLAKTARMACFVVLQPFASRPFRRFLATTASADSSQALTREVSPGKVPRLSARIARLYLIRLSVTVGFRVP
mgnify:FL=1